MTTEKKKMSFEEAMEKLEAIVDKLEDGDVPLEKAITMYQEGMKLSQLCHEKLQAVEKQMDVIMKEDGHMEPLKLGEDTE